LDVPSQVIWNTAKPNIESFHLKSNKKTAHTNITLYRWQKFCDWWIDVCSNSTIGVRRADTCRGRRRWSYFWSSPRHSRNFLKPVTMLADSVGDLKGKWDSISLSWYEVLTWSCKPQAPSRRPEGRGHPWFYVNQTML
jgi:hypothetical protein